MSKQNRGPLVPTVAYIKNQANTLASEEFEKLYGIIFLEHGEILDTTYNQTFESIGAWAEFSINEDATEYSEHINGHYYDEEGHF